jgi:hypothetical protein
VVMSTWCLEMGFLSRLSIRFLCLRRRLQCRRYESVGTNLSINEDFIKFVNENKKELRLNVQ